ncbi:tRNA (adenosine(37)-N6)-threonylcarbamoyltransferase complex ATPase subunit type 1 TsaE [Terricaulis silvestris]|uniref:tRNA threonylcarbamoyladenosine biosynthesis protein TsaE n=1 Tax=Terricaulis silvestris TaxID=2686094 RepID=A0A6I6MKU0_9CAUL|nr:tRNA (adenosine(37)-N6)-threonylcarbamoyltransferase complex ATPase subunit type 1 TsaE [Terricaulis silvestris]QGZ93574.1 ADP-binding protein [Terricaulis silvestris]
MNAIATTRATTRSPEETVALGRALAADLRTGDIVLVCGPMGAGKTYLAKGLIAGMGGAAEDDVASPAYDIVHQFPGREMVFHYDLFRLQQLSGEDVEWIMELLQQDGVHVIEWGDRLEGALRRPFAKITIGFGESDEDRVIDIEGAQP